ncbi:MAG: hypothetical protein M3N21_02255 [Actinomycetota bacterium]|nr:hypothetical protein [Actinomycetota bacterium]
MRPVTLRGASPYLLAALFTTTGILHFVTPRTFDAIIPNAVPAKRAVTYLSGVGELACAGALIRRRTRLWGARASFMLLVVVFPANIQMALDARGAIGRALAYGRLPVQLPLLWWAWAVHRDTTRRQGATFTRPAR